MSSPASLLDDFPALAKARQHWANHQVEAAIAAFEAALNEQPANVRGAVEASRALMQLWEVGSAIKVLENCAERTNGADPQLIEPLASSFRSVYRPLRAMELLEPLAQADRISARGLTELALVYEMTDRVDKAVDAIERALVIDPQQPEPKLLKARLERRRGNAKQAESILLELSSVAVNDDLLVQTQAELCLLYDGIGQYQSAIDANNRAKQFLIRQNQVGELKRQSAAISQILTKLYTELSRKQIDGWLAEPPLEDVRVGGFAHLLSFPRSGTTLLEQVLASHPNVFDSPERATFTAHIVPPLIARNRGGGLNVASLEAADRIRREKCRKRYVEVSSAIEGHPIGGRLHLDKNPNHTSLAALLLRAFPESRFVFALRDPRDVITSVFLRTFPLTEFSVNFLEIKSLCTIYDNEMKLWTRFSELVPERVCTVRYEDLVADLSGVASRTCDFLGLPADETVASYRSARQYKIINSPSHAQVREAVNDRSIGRWKNYADLLEPVMPLLEPWIDKFGYR